MKKHRLNVRVDGFKIHLTPSKVRPILTFEGGVLSDPADGSSKKVGEKTGRKNKGGRQVIICRKKALIRLKKFDRHVILEVVILNERAKIT